LKGIEIGLLAIGGVIGTILRYKIVESPLVLGALPINVLIVNVIGSFILGIFVVLSQQWNLDGKYALLIAFGFAGSFTTMSAFALESSNLLENSSYGLMAVNILANVGLSIGAIFGGRAIMNAIINGM
jgi:fluoride exporter